MIHKVQICQDTNVRTYSVLQIAHENVPTCSSGVFANYLRQKKVLGHSSKKTTTTTSYFSISINQYTLLLLLFSFHSLTLVASASATFHIEEGEEAFTSKEKFIKAAAAAAAASLFRYQCDQMARLFFNIGPFIPM